MAGFAGVDQIHFTQIAEHRTTLHRFLAGVSTDGPGRPRDLYVALSCVVKTGAQKYFDKRARESREYRRALSEARARIAVTDRLVRALEERRVALGLSKAELLLDLLYHRADGGEV